jgi:hypothetical protein
MKTAHDVLMFCYGVLICGIGGCLTTLYVRQRYENALEITERQLNKCRWHMNIWRKIANDRLSMRKAA